MADPLEILILEDNEADAKLLLHELKRSGRPFNWRRVESEEDFREALASQPDIILADYTMPRFDAPQALRILQEIGYDIPFIVVTGTISEEIAVECMKEGATDYLLKGRLTRLNQAMERALEQRDARRAKREAEAALIESEARFRAAVQYSSDIITILDENGTIRYESPAVQRILGYAPEELVGRSAVDFIHPDDVEPLFKGFLKSMVENTEAPMAQYRFLHANGSWAYLESVSSPVSAGSIDGYVINSRDITERVKLEEQLRHAQKMEAVGRLASGVAHDFNNILMAITGYAQVLLEEVDNGSPMRADLHEINSAADRAAGLVRQLLVFSRREETERQLVYMDAVVRDVIKLVKRVTGDAVEIELRLADELKAVYGDVGQFEQVLMNLAINARDAMPEGGRLTITAREEVLNERVTSLDCTLNPGPHVVLEVADTGVGMDADTLSRAFEPFFTTKDTGSGTGLGLATVYGIVKGFDGLIGVSSEPGKGATFSVYFPVVEQPEAGEPDQESTEARVSSLEGSETVLVAEDESQLRALIQLALENFGYHVHVAADGAEAVERFKEYRNDVAVLVTDLTIPRIPGDVLYMELRSMAPDLKVVFISGHPPGALDAYRLPEGARYLQKPFSFTDLAQAVRETCDGIEGRRRPSVGGRASHESHTPETGT